MRVYKLASIILFVFIATCDVEETAQKTQEKEWLSYQPTVVELKGALSVQTYYGPPNYGENPDTGQGRAAHPNPYETDKCSWKPRRQGWI